MLEVLDTGISSAQDNMLFDEKLLENIEPNAKPILHLYRWERPSATYGYFIRPESHLNFEMIAKHGLDLARRPTGGGIVFHIWDLAFSFLMPAKHDCFSLNTLENYEFVNQAVLKTVKTYFSLDPELIEEDAPSKSPDCRNFCMAKPTQYDVVLGGMKIAGAAQRRRKQGYLHQGTISLFKPEISMLEDVLLSKDVLQAIASYTYVPIEKGSLEKARVDLQKLLEINLSEALESVPH